MNTIEINKLDILLSAFYPVGYGRTSHVFLTPGLEVIKLYKHNSFGQAILNNPDFPKKLERMSTLTNDSYQGPTDLLTYKGQFAGYTYPYIMAHTLAKVDKDMPVSKLFVNYPKLMKDTRKISDQHFLLEDPHHRNILFNGLYSVIDLDLGEFKDDLNQEIIFTENMNNLFETILKEIYHINRSHSVMFEDKDLNLIYHHMKRYSMDDIEELLKIFADKCGKANPSIKDVRKKVKAEGVNLGYKKKN